MIDGMAPQEKMVGDDAAMTTPPYGFRAHQCRAVVAAKTKQFFEGDGEFGAQRIVGIIVETLNASEGVAGFTNAGLLWPSPAKSSEMPVADL
jgi:hypothetical protein